MGSEMCIRDRAKHLFKWSRCSTAIGVAALRFSRPRGGETFLMLRNKEPELAENIDSSFEWFDLVFYRVIFVFGSRHLILVRCFMMRQRHFLCAALTSLPRRAQDSTETRHLNRGNQKGRMLICYTASVRVNPWAIRPNEYLNP